MGLLHILAQVTVLFQQGCCLIRLHQYDDGPYKDEDPGRTDDGDDDEEVTVAKT